MQIRLSIACETKGGHLKVVQGEWVKERVSELLQCTPFATVVITI